MIIMRHGSHLARAGIPAQFPGTSELETRRESPTSKFRFKFGRKSPGIQRAPVSRFGRFDFKGLQVQVPSHSVVCGARTIPADIRGPGWRACHWQLLSDARLNSATTPGPLSVRMTVISLCGLSIVTGSYW